MLNFNEETMHMSDACLPTTIGPSACGISLCYNFPACLPTVNLHACISLDNVRSEPYLSLIFLLAKVDAFVALVSAATLPGRSLPHGPHGAVVALLTTTTEKLS